MLTLKNISKRFESVLALADVDAAFKPGTVHGVLGENGAGKTTLMRIAAGLLRPDGGTVSVGGREMRFRSALDAARAGVAMVHQHFMLVPTLTVAENCLLGRREWGQVVSRPALNRRIAELSRRVGLEVDPEARVESLSVGEQQRAEIVRGLSMDARLLILDEPTAVLTPQEADQLFAALDRLRRGGLAIAFISHKLGEVERICDELTILRQGRRVYHGPAASLSTAQMAEHMVGASLAPLPSRAPVRADARPRLEVRDVEACDRASHRRIREINLTVRAGEIVGIAGVEGNGQDLLAAVIVGTHRSTRGQILLSGVDMTRANVRARAASGLSHIAEDRLKQALVPAMTLGENLVLRSFDRAPYARRGFMRWREVYEHGERALGRFDIRAASAKATARQLSGGNQQKVVLARELGGEPGVVLAQNPVRGLDVAATQFVFEQLLRQRERGAAVLLIHSDLDELLSVADRVAVMTGGRCVMTDWSPLSSASAEARARIGRLMLGGAA